MAIRSQFRAGSFTLNDVPFVNVLIGTLITLAITGFSPATWAIAENDYQAQYQKQVVPFFETIGKTGNILGEKSRVLPYISFTHPAARASIVIAEGYDESFFKYDELAFDLYQQGYSIYILDDRGQGSTQHFLADSRKGYVDQFRFFTTDLKRFVDRVVPRESGAPRFLLAHSMGGAIAARYLETYPGDFQAAVLSSPMLSIDLGRAEWVADVELHGLRTLGKDQDLAPGTRLYDPAQESFGSNIVTHSQVRYDKNVKILVNHPEVFVAGQTVHWLIEEIKGSRWARAHGERTQTPILLLQAGADQMVLPQGQAQFCRAAAACELVVVDQARHEILQETDAIREPALKRILNFFAARAGAVKGHP